MGSRRGLFAQLALEIGEDVLLDGVGLGFGRLGLGCRLLASLVVADALEQVSELVIGGSGLGPLGRHGGRQRGPWSSCLGRD